MSKLDPTQYREVRLQGTTWAIQVPVTVETLGDVSARVHIDHALRSGVIQLRGTLWYENLKTIEYPADWWEAVKARWLPGWAKRRWPIRYKHYEVNAYYPGVRWPDHEGVVRVPYLEDRYNTRCIHAQEI